MQSVNKKGNVENKIFKHVYLSLDIHQNFGKPLEMGKGALELQV